MKEHEFWREKVGRHVYAVELVDGVVAGSCGPLDVADIDERFLATFDYAPDRGAWIEHHRDLFDLYETRPGVAIPESTPAPAPLASRLVSDVMHPGVMTCHSGSSLHEVARTMATHGVHSVAIWGDDGEDSIGFVGIISALDLLSAVIGGESLASSALVAAHQDVHTVRASAPLSEAARLMADERATHVIVLDDERDRIVGVLSALDVTRALTLA
jgi:CBS domain-containing protein